MTKKILFASLFALTLFSACRQDIYQYESDGKISAKFSGTTADGIEVDESATLRLYEGEYDGWFSEHTNNNEKYFTISFERNDKHGNEIEISLYVDASGKLLEADIDVRVIFEKKDRRLLQLGNNFDYDSDDTENDLNYYRPRI